MIDRRTFLGMGVGGALLAGLGGTAGAALTPGKNYIAIGQPFATETGAKVEVLEFFWYGCPHCFDLEPLINAWLKKLPADAQFRRIPAIFSDAWAPGARLYFTLEAMGLLERLHGPVFDAIHVQRLPLADRSVAKAEEAIKDWVAKQGVDRAKFEAAYKSFAVETKVKRAQQLSRSSGIDGVPAMIVDGRYLATGPLAGTHEAMLAVVDELVAKARSERAKKK